MADCITAEKPENVGEQIVRFVDLQNGSDAGWHTHRVLVAFIDKSRQRFVQQQKNTQI